MWLEKEVGVGAEQLQADQRQVHPALKSPPLPASFIGSTGRLQIHTFGRNKRQNIRILWPPLVVLAGASLSSPPVGSHQGRLLLTSLLQRFGSDSSQYYSHKVFQQSCNKCTCNMQIKYTSTL